MVVLNFVRNSATFLNFRSQKSQFKSHMRPFKSQLGALRGEVKNVSANQRPGQPTCISDWPEKHKLGRGR